MKLSWGLQLAIVATAACAASAASTCPENCTKEFAPVCGSDGKTYGNKCEFEVAKCRAASTGKTLTLAKDGECAGSGPGGGEQDEACKAGFACPAIEDPVCGSDGKTYSSECVLRLAKCKSPGLVVANKGECGKTPTPKPSGGGAPGNSSAGSAATGCDKPCTKEMKPVCGSDGKTYNNQCLLGNAQCRNKALTKVADEACKAGTSGSVASAAGTSSNGESPAPSSSSAPSTTTSAPKPGPVPSPTRSGSATTASATSGLVVTVATAAAAWWMSA